MQVNTMPPYRVLLEGSDEPLGRRNFDSLCPKVGDYAGVFDVDGKLIPCYITRVDPQDLRLDKDEAGKDILIRGTVWVCPESSLQS